MNKILKQMWYFAEKSYKPIGTFRVLGHDKMLFIDRRKFIVFAFAGSDDLKDWVNNFKVNDLQEHKGFYESFSKFKREIFFILDQHPKKNIYITGHSRGAAIATFCAEFIARECNRPCSCFAFASPMVGNKKFRESYNKLPINHTVIRNGWDIVTYVPPGIFRHVGKRIRLKQPWFHRLMFWRVKDHLQASYKKAVAKYYKGR